MTRTSAGFTSAIIAETEYERAMAANDYVLPTRWRVRGDVRDVADILDDPLDLPRWWGPVYLDVTEVSPGENGGVGRVVNILSKGWLPYRLRWQLTVVESRYPYGFAIDAHGDFEGHGVWTFEQDGEFVNATFDWRLRAEKPLLRYLSVVLKPVFAANHRWAMRRGLEGLTRELARKSRSDKIA
jgi:polyketide cyclase/dehydrase/lipid transport protein